jgi:indole-3-glycerol phosphate synthase
MDMDLAVRVRPLIPADRLVVAESGIKTSADVERLRAAGVDAILVGETLMQAPDPAAALRALVGGA